MIFDFWLMVCCLDLFKPTWQVLANTLLFAPILMSAVRAPSTLILHGNYRNCHCRGRMRWSAFAVPEGHRFSWRTPESFHKGGISVDFAVGLQEFDVCSKHSHQQCIPLSMARNTALYSATDTDFSRAKVPGMMFSSRLNVLCVVHAWERFSRSRVA